MVALPPCTGRKLRIAGRLLGESHGGARMGAAHDLLEIAR
jgi:hypothetical protein